MNKEASNRKDSSASFLFPEPVQTVFEGEAIILAGGLGTRLKEVIPDLPKCMAPVAGRPFLFYVINYLRSEGIRKFIFALGHQHEIIEQYLNTEFATLDFEISTEEVPLLTGGAIRLACSKAKGKNIIIVNGDTLFKVSLEELASFHLLKQTECTLALKPMLDFSRYGAVELDDAGFVRTFREKQFIEKGYINGGTYALQMNKFLQEDLPEKFLFEKDWLEKKAGTDQISGLPQDRYFIDIGIPEDYSRANEELRLSPIHLAGVNKDWTLFIDRDGVINKEKKDGYIMNWREFDFYDGVRESFHQINQKFGRVIIVSNQRGVGKGLMSETGLHAIHKHMQKQIETAGGMIDRIYYCTSTDEKHPDRKPNPGMAFQAKRDFPSIDLSRSVMVGNKLSDMQFGRNAGMHTVFIKTTHPEQLFPHPDIDLVFDSLPDFAKAL